MQEKANMGDRFDAAVKKHRAARTPEETACVAAMKDLAQARATRVKAEEVLKAALNRVEEAQSAEALAGIAAEKADAALEQPPDADV